MEQLRKEVRGVLLFSQNSKYRPVRYTKSRRAYIQGGGGGVHNCNRKGWFTVGRGAYDRNLVVLLFYTQLQVVLVMQI